MIKIVFELKNDDNALKIKVKLYTYNNIRLFIVQQMDV